MSAWAKPGAKCVCINDAWGSLNVGGRSIPTRVPMLNEVLTIAGVKFDETGTQYLSFAEIPVRQDDGGLSGEIRWIADHFRPLVTRTQEQDVAIFRPLLETIGEDA